MQLITADWIHHGKTFHQGHALLVSEAGEVVAAGPEQEVRGRPEASGAEEVTFAGQAILPGTVSAHSHCFQVLLRGHGDHPLSFQDWVKRVLYPMVERLDQDSLEAAALLCFSNMARAGITTVGEFHYVHNREDDYAPMSEALCETVIGAARRVGLRIALIRTLYDVQERHGQARFAEAPAEALDRTRALAARYAGDPLVSVIPAPHSLHGATREGIEGAAALAEELGCRWHIHLSEQRGDVGYAERFHEATPLRVLERWGVLSERTVVVHGIWLDEVERALMAERGVGLVSNPTTNMALGDGIAPLTELMQRGVTVGLGTDLNACPNVFAEMRAAEYLQRVQSLRMGRLPTAAGGEHAEPWRLFDMGTRNGGALLGLSVGALEPGFAADFLAVRLSDPSLLPAGLLGGDALLNALSSSMVPESAVRGSFVAGKAISRDGVLEGIDEDELHRRVQGAKALAGC